MSKRKVKVTNLGFMSIGDSTPEESMIARLYAIPKGRRRSVVHDLADRYGLGIRRRENGLSGYYDYVDTLLEEADAQYLRMGGVEEPMPTKAVSGRRISLAPPPIPPLNCTHVMIKGPRRGKPCGKVSVREEHGKRVCHQHTQSNVSYQRSRQRTARAARLARLEDDDPYNL